MGAWLIAMFCGFFVAAGDQPLVADATQIVVMRMGTRTVLTMESSYQGPADAFALVVPVPAGVHEGDVKTLPREVVAHVDQLGAPRLVEYWEQDPCGEPAAEVKHGAAPDEASVDARFAVGEYQIAILSPKDSAGLEAWLRDNHYHVAPGAAALVRPYVERGMKFLVAKVDPAKLQLEHGRAVLSPLRIAYDADALALPIRLGLANSGGSQDLIVNVLAPHQRYRVASYDNVAIATDLDVAPAVRDRFGAFYAALFDATLAQHPHAFVTEYASRVSIDPGELELLGADVLAADHGKPARYDGDDFVLTRVHARYGRDLARDLVLEPAPANASFQARYAIRHPSTGPLRCEQPSYGRWGAPSREQLALDLATAPRGPVQVPEPRATRAARPLRTGGCSASDPAGLALALVLLVRPKRRRAR